MQALSVPTVVLRPLVVAVLGLGLLGLISASAQTPRGRSQAPAEAARPADAEALKQREQELEALRTEQRKTLEREAALKREIESIGDDRRKFNQQIIEIAARVVSLEERIAKTHERLSPLDGQEQALRESLERRRSVIAEVLAALQRIGRHAPPALFVRAEDALTSVRSAIMLGAVLPEMRQQAEALVRDLSDLVRLRTEIALERDTLARDLAALASDQQRLALLVEGRQKRLTAAESELEAERQRAAAFARQADNVKDLIAKLEQGLDSDTRSARAAARAALESPPAGAPGDSERLGPAVIFASARGLLPLPVNGVKIRNFGDPDSMGGAEKGLAIAARPGAQVTSPCDGLVVYSGPFRSYGQLLILNAGGGYHVILMGMERISVDPGQFVLTGEPVAAMGSGGQIAAAVATTTPSQPVLYIEFRKDGAPIDPGPWWATSESEKVRG